MTMPLVRMGEPAFAIRGAQRAQSGESPITH